MPQDEEVSLLRPTRSPNPRTSSSVIRQTHSPNLIVFLLTCMIFILEVGAYMMAIPITRIQEDIICHHYYENTVGSGHIGLTEEISEGLCKVDEIQTELAFVRGIYSTLSALPGLFFSMPYGLLADRIGRKPVLILSLFGLILSSCWMLAVSWFWRVFPLRLIWLAPIFQAIGGGNIVAVTMILTSVSDAVTQEGRSTAFFRASVGGMLAEIVGPAIGSKLMSVSLWMPILIGLGIVIVGSSILLVIPETLHTRHTPASDSSATEIPEDELERPVEPKDATFVQSFIYNCKVAFYQLRESTAVLASPPILLLLLTFITRSITPQSVDFIPQYLSKRFNWTLQRTGYIISVRAAFNILLVLAVLPWISHWLTTVKHYTTETRDLLLARISSLILVLGALLIAGPNITMSIFGIIIYTMGAGFISLTRSLLTTLADGQHTATLYSAAGIIDMIGIMALGPGIPLLWKLGLKWKGDWLGLPFFGVSVLCAIAALCVWVFRAPKKEVEEDEERGE